MNRDTPVLHLWLVVLLALLLAVQAIAALPMFHHVLVTENGKPCQHVAHNVWQCP